MEAARRGICVHNKVFIICLLKYLLLLIGGGAAILVVSSLILLLASSSMVEHSTVNRRVVGSSPIWPALFHPGRNNYRKKETIIVLITKKECIELQKLGHRFGSEGTLYHTWSRKRKKYYLTESRKAMADLERIRKSRIVEK